MGHLRVGLRAFLLAVMGAAVALFVSVLPMWDLAGEEWLFAGIVLAFATIAARAPIRLDHKKKLTLEDAATLVAALLLAPPVAMLVTAGATLTLRFSRTRWYERAFNAAKSALAVGIAALLYRALTPPATAGIDPWSGVIAAVAKYLTSVTLVDLAIAFQTGRAPSTTWWERRRPGLVPALGTHLFGLLGAATGATQPWVLGLLAVPSATVWVLMRESERARERASALLYELADVAELRDPYGRGRSQEVALVAERIARRMGMTAERTRVIRDAARLQHIGTLDVPPSAIVRADEQDRHTDLGARRLAQVHELSEHAVIVGAHHEHVDGTGPHGLRGEEIPIEASIVGIADEYVRLARPRPGHDALPPEQLAGVLERGRATRWPPQVVDALLHDMPALAAEPPIGARVEVSA